MENSDYVESLLKRPMRRPNNLKKVTALLGLAAALGLLAAAPALTQEQKGFSNVVELKRLLEVAREAGFSDKEMREITIEDGKGNVFNVWAYLEEVERLKRLEAEKLKAQKEKVYLTVQDVFTDLKKEEPADLSRLRDKIPTHP